MSKAPEGRRARMAFYNTLTDKQLSKLPDSELGFLSVNAVNRLPEERQRVHERLMAPELQKILEESRAWRSELDAIVMALGDGDIDYHRAEIELYRATGISVDKLRDLWEGDFWAYARAELNRRDPWVKVKAADCKVDRSTLKRHADDESRPYIKHDERGYYMIRQSKLSDYQK